MTLEEAIKILKKEGYCVEKVGTPRSPGIAFTEYESPEICEAMQVVCSAGYGISMLSSCFAERKARLSLALAENCDAPVSGKEQSKEGNPALKEAASQFNDALLDEQGKKIKRLGKEIARLNGIIHDKNAILSDVAEELRLSKIREKNLTEVGQKYMEENEKLKEKLANKVVDKIDAHALKSAESTLAYKENVIDELAKENNDYKKCVEEFRNKIADMTIGKIDIQNIRLKEKDKEIKELNDKLKSINENRHKELTEKDEVITDFGKELKAMKQQLDSYTKMAQKMAKVIVHKKPVTVDFFEMCWELAYSEEKEAVEELSKVLNDVIDRFLLFGGIITKEE